MKPCTYGMHDFFLKRKKAFPEESRCSGVRRWRWCLFLCSGGVDLHPHCDGFVARPSFEKHGEEKKSRPAQVIHSTAWSDPMIELYLGRMTSKDMLKNALKGTVKWPTRRFQHSYFAAALCVDDRQFKNRRIGDDWRIVKRMRSKWLSSVCISHAPADLTSYGVSIFWTRSATKWNRAGDGRLASLMAYIHHHCKLQTILSRWE